MPKYGIRLFSLLILGVVAAWIAREFLVDPSFYVYGHFRGAAMPEIAAPAPAYQGSASCRECHTAVFEKWRSGVHGGHVKCETCHGPARDHAKKKNKLPIPKDARRLCTQCHEKMPARPKAQPQIVVADHAGDQQCTVCHDPHSPGMGQGTAGGSPIEARCSRCHGKHGEGVGKFPALAGKSVEYLTEQLEKYRSGEISNPMMATVTKALSDDEIAALAKHYAAITTKNGAPALAESCDACHGDRGTGGDNVPAIAGLDATAIAAALEAYRSGARKNPVMRTVAEPLSQEAIHELAGYYAGIKQPAAGGTVDPSEECAGCHGDNGEGDGGDTPALAGKSEPWLVQQLEAYRSGKRKNDMMSPIAESLTDEDIAALAKHYAALPAAGQQ